MLLTEHLCPVCYRLEAEHHPILLRPCQFRLKLVHLSTQSSLTTERWALNPHLGVTGVGAPPGPRETGSIPKRVVEEGPRDEAAGGDGAILGGALGWDCRRHTAQARICQSPSPLPAIWLSSRLLTYRLWFW